MCSPCSGEGEGLHPAPGQLLVVRQQPVHQSQRQRCVGVRRGLRLELRVRGGGAAQQEEAARGGQLESRAGSDPRYGRGGGARGGWATRECSLSKLHPFMPTTTTTTTRLCLPPSTSSSFSLLHLWVGSHWRLMTPLKLPHTAAAATIASLPA